MLWICTCDAKFPICAFNNFSKVLQYSVDLLTKVVTGHAL